jgi:anhydro-N-acetylmuramic acid kinase
LDVALCQISDSGRKTEVKLIQFETVDYSEDIKLKSDLYLQNKLSTFRNSLLNEWIGIFVADMIPKMLAPMGISAEKR